VHHQAPAIEGAGDRVQWFALAPASPQLDLVRRAQVPPPSSSPHPSLSLSRNGGHTASDAVSGSIDDQSVIARAYVHGEVAATAETPVRIFRYSD
jgi:hypothetical protein